MVHLSVLEENRPLNCLKEFLLWMKPDILLQTSQHARIYPGVFAIGDVRTKALRQVVTAVADGATASHYIEEYLAHQI